LMIDDPGCRSSPEAERAGRKGGQNSCASRKKATRKQFTGARGKNDFKNIYESHMKRNRTIAAGTFQDGYEIIEGR